MPKLLSNLKPAPGSVKKNHKRRGRGEGSGLGVTAGRGHKGQQSRSGAKRRAWFEGGQMPIQRRLPKRGFKNIWREEVQVVNLKDLDRLEEGILEITPEVLVKHGMIKHAGRPVKLLGDGEATRAWKVDLTAVSKGAEEKVKAAGGEVTVPPPAPKRGKYKKRAERESVEA